MKLVDLIVLKTKITSLQEESIVSLCLYFKATAYSEVLKDSK